MIERITAKDSIWDAAPFAKEAALFNLLYRLREYDNPLLLTDRETIFAAQTSPDMPAWIWTKDGIDPQCVENLADAYHIEKMTVKPVIADTMADRFRVTHRLLSNICKTIIEPQTDGRMSRFEPFEVHTIAKGLVGFDQDAMHSTSTVESKMEAACALTSNPDAFVWRTPCGEIASFASIMHRTAIHGRINTVYTYPHLRGKGYAGAVVAVCCKLLLAEGRIPLLYTDALYPSSNRAYQKVGFMPVGELFTVERNT